MLLNKIKINNGGFVARDGDPLVVWKTLPADVMTFFFLLFTRFWAENWTSTNVMTFSVVLHRIWGGKLDICKRDDFFLLYT